MLYVKVPHERIGVVIGPNGSTKRELEERTGVKLEIDSELGDVTVDERNARDPVLALKVSDVIRAIGRGFAPQKAFKLLEDEVFFVSIDIRDYVGKKSHHVMRMRARVIGTRGKTRKIIEELTGALISVYGNTVSIIGSTTEMDIAHTAIDMLLSGSEHATVYNYLENRRKELKLLEKGL